MILSRKKRNLAGEEGFEPPIFWTKTSCLTTWPLPRLVSKFLRAGKKDFPILEIFLKMERRIFGKKCAKKFGK